MANSANQRERMISPGVMASLIVIGVIALGALWLRTGLIGADRWPIRWLDVAGDLDRTSASQIRAAAVEPASRGFFAVELAAVREAVAALPWVARVSVSRHWPDALQVHVTEHRPIARWNDRRLFSDRGEVFEVSGSDGMQGLARLYGPSSRRDEVLDAWLDMRRELAREGLDISQLWVDQRGAWRLELDTGLDLMLGREQVRERLQRFIAVYARIGDGERRPRRVDMRYTNGLAVDWGNQESNEVDNHG